MHLLPQFRAIEEGRLERPTYARLLAALLAYHTVIAQAGGQSGLSSSARRRDYLLADLAYLNADAAPETPLLDLDDPDALLGALYVAEGSMLGGRVIARQLDYLFGSDDDGRRFFAGSREDEATWHRLLAALEASDPGEYRLQRMVSGAEASFAHFEKCIGAFA